MSVTTAIASQVSDQFIDVSWTLDDPAAIVTLDMSRDAAPAVRVAEVDSPQLGFRFVITEFEPVGTVLVFSAYIPADVATPTLASPLTVRVFPSDPTYGVVDPLVSAPRYTTVADVKKALEINDTDFDAEISQAIVAAEIAIDTFNGRSFPDTGDDPEIAGIPDPIKVWALSASIGTFKLRDTVAGSFGAEDWLGSIDVNEQARRALHRNPLAYSYRVAWGVA